jgi:hypothetical protein
MIELPDSEQRLYNLKLFYYQKYVIKSDLEINVYKLFRELNTKYESDHGDYSSLVGTPKFLPKMIDRYDSICDQIKNKIYEGKNGAR